MIDKSRRWNLFNYELDLFVYYNHWCHFLQKYGLQTSGATSYN